MSATRPIFGCLTASATSESNKRLTLDHCQSIPLTFRAMFHQYFQMAARIRKHYLSPRVLLCLLTGKFVPPINRKNLYSLQYSMLPAKRSGIMEMWAAVNSLVRNEKRQPLPVMNGRLTRTRGYGGH